MGLILTRTWPIVGTWCSRREVWESKPVSFLLLLFGCPVVSDSLWPHGLQHSRPPCPSPPPKVCPNFGPYHCYFPSPILHTLLQTQETLPCTFISFLFSLEAKIMVSFLPCTPYTHTCTLIREGFLRHSSTQWFLESFLFGSWHEWINFSRQPIRKCKPRDILNDSIIVPGGT